MNNNHSYFRFRGFTLIELLITVSVMMILAATVIPKVSTFGDRITFNNRVEEIESLINQEISLLKNPEQGVSYYRLVIEDDLKTMVLYNNLSTEPKGRIILDGNESLARLDGKAYLRCDIPFKDSSCTFRDGSGTVVTAGGSQFVRYDNEASGSKTIKVLFSPLIVKSE
ncbi:MAG: prepilin-type N-terminal cleavage/methylation domain-containing protein [Patescibacteria group bacterium]|jgi:prepilin-type N-terminal cleavage/methylation domain-containing protein